MRTCRPSGSLIAALFMASKPVSRPPRTAGHAQGDALIRQFADAGLVPVLSVNGSTPDADIQVVKGAQAGEVIEAWLTKHGSERVLARYLETHD